MRKIYILIWIYRGLIQDPMVFNNLVDAESMKEEIIKNGFNHDYDEIQIFEKYV
jgi:hypothetical protein